MKTGAPAAVNAQFESGSGPVDTLPAVPADRGALAFAAFSDYLASGTDTITLTNLSFTSQFTETAAGTYITGGVADWINPAGPFAADCTWTVAGSVAGWEAVVAVYDAVGALPRAGYVPVGVPGTWTLCYDEEFPGTTLNAANWEISTNLVNTVISTPANVSVNNGLTLTLSDSGHGACIESWTNWFQVGMCIEARIWFPGPGAPTPGNAIYNWPAWWLSGTDSEPPSAGEIDIAEGFDGALSINYHSISTGGITGGRPAGNWSNSWRTYSVYRRPSSFTASGTASRCGPGSAATTVSGSRCSSTWAGHRCLRDRLAGAGRLRAGLEKREPADGGFPVMTWTAAGSLIGVSASFTPVTAGDLILLEIMNASNGTVWCTGVSSPNATWAQMGTVFTAAAATA